MSKHITIEGFEQLSKQQLFDMSLAHLRTTRIKSVSRTGGSYCSYSGAGCAAAPFIREDQRKLADNPDGKIIPPGLSWSGLVDRGLVPPHESSFVYELQACHDNASVSCFSRDVERFFKELASEEDLVYTPETPKEPS